MLNTCLLVLTFFIGPLAAAHFEHMIDLTITVEDVGFNLSVKSVKFNGQEIKLDAPDMFKPRKEAKYRLAPGRYILNWTTEKGGGGPKWATEVPVDHERILVLESGDTSVKVNIRGDNISLY